MFGVYSYTFPAIQGAYGNIMRHLDALDITVLSVMLVDSAYTIVTADPIDPDQLEHLKMIEAS